MKQQDQLSRQKFRYLFEQLDGFHANHTESDEWALSTAISDGKVDKVQEILKAGADVDYQIIDNNQLKTYEYLAVSAVAVTTRIAILSGMPGTEAFRFSDICLQRIAECHTVEEMQEAENDCILEFTRQLQILNQTTEHNRLVEQAKYYIAEHIYEPVSLCDVATAINVSASYLGRLFKSYENLTVGDYIRIRKMETAKESLVYSNKSIQEIANYFGFPSQSYFAKQFKTVTGMTPLEYRNRFGNRVVE